MISVIVLLYNYLKKIHLVPHRRHLGSQLCELEKLIDKMMVEDFTMYARSDLSRSLREEPQVLEKVREQQHALHRLYRQDRIC